MFVLFWKKALGSFLHSEHYSGKITVSSHLCSFVHWQKDQEANEPGSKSSTVWE